MDGKTIQAGDQFLAACGSRIEINERVLRHLEAHPEVMALLPEAICKIRLPPNAFAEIEVGMNRVVGRTNLVATTFSHPSSSMQFAMRKGRNGPTRVTTEVSVGPEADKMVLVVKWQSPGIFQLVTSWIGGLAQKEPWDPSIQNERDFQRCLNFWCSNALLYDPELMEPVFRSSWTDALKDCR